MERHSKEEESQGSHQRRHERSEARSGRRVKKSAGFDLNQGLGHLASRTLDPVKNFLMLPGRDPLIAAGVGAGLGGLYHLGKKKYYNDADENEQDNSAGQLLKHIGIPAACRWTLATGARINAHSWPTSALCGPSHLQGSCAESPRPAQSASRQNFWVPLSSMRESL